MSSARASAAARSRSGAGLIISRSIGSLIGPGAISTLQASGEVYNLSDVSQFSGPWIQGTGSLAITAKATGELWLENRNGVVMRLSAAQAGLTFSTGRYELYIQLSQ